MEEVPLAAPRPPDVSLDSRLAFSLGYSPGTLEEEWEQCPYLQALREK